MTTREVHQLSCRLLLRALWNQRDLSIIFPYWIIPSLSSSGLHCHVIQMTLIPADGTEFHAQYLKLIQNSWNASCWQTVIFQNSRWVTGTYTCTKLTVTFIIYNNNFCYRTNWLGQDYGLPSLVFWPWQKASSNMWQFGRVMYCCHMLSAGHINPSHDISVELLFWSRSIVATS